MTFKAGIVWCVIIPFDKNPLTIDGWRRLNWRHTVTGWGTLRGLPGNLGLMLELMVYNQVFFIAWARAGRRLPLVARIGEWSSGPRKMVAPGLPSKSSLQFQRTFSFSLTQGPSHLWRCCLACQLVGLRQHPGCQWWGQQGDPENVFPFS